MGTNPTGRLKKTSMMVENAMSVRKLAAGLITTVLSLGVANTGLANDHAPELDPFAFDPDFRWFEPVYDVDLEELKPEKRAPNGWFATYDRLNLYGSRPETINTSLIGGEGRLDDGWGQRYEVGYMAPGENSGFTFTYTESEVDEGAVNRFEAANRFLTDGADGSVTTNGFGVTVPPGEANNLNFSFRFFDEIQTINSFDYDAIEFNKTWRMTPYHYGGILEPMVGFRYMSFTDRTASDAFTPAIDLATGLTNVTALGLSDTLTTAQALTENDMITGQVGFRYMKQRRRFTFSSDFRAFLGNNYQNSEFTTATTIQAYGDDTTITIGDPGVRIQTDRSGPIIDRNEEFVIGFDVRGEVGYQISRMVQVRAGFQLIDIGTGVWRGGEAGSIGGGLIGGDRDQDVLMFGGTFGISLNH